MVTGNLVTWLEPRPAEGGRSVIMGRSADGPIREITPPGFNVRDTVHEYGGAAYWMHGQSIYFANYEDQRLYRQPIGGQPQPITPEPNTHWGLRYADGCLAADGRWIVCVRERHHPDREADNELIALPADGSAEAQIIAGGRNFYSNPRISPDGTRLIYLCWDHPNMPWDGTELWAADLAADCTLSHDQLIAGGPDESIFQPEWGADGAITFCSDRSGWWNLYRWQAGKVTPLTQVEAEIGAPLWELGYQMYAFLSGGRIACIACADGKEQLCLVPAGGQPQPLPINFAGYAGSLVSSGDDTLYFSAGGPTQPNVIAQYRVGSNELTIVRQTVDLPFDRAYLSEPQHITFPTTGGEVAHALYYPPTNPDYQAPPGEKPPLLVQSHGGPTDCAFTMLRLPYQYWTSRGFAVVDVNYRGSTGFGRAYWKKLYGQWGVIDVEDCISAAHYLADRGLADPQRMAISGGSAGGYCTLCALTFHDDFQAGSSWYGIGDMATLTGDMHKFESRYCDMLVANTYPAPKDVLFERSPIHFTERLSAPMILLQGLEDKVVSPDQAEAMARALDEKGLPYVYLAFEGEQHGFRKAETLIRCFEAEEYFYSKIFGFEPADPIDPVEIKNL
jgi:dipeptidyl aminopeptidase/acylaminoacyl peptidase